MKTVPWWSKKLEELKTNKNRAWNQLTRCITTEILKHFKKTKALFRKHLKESKKIALQTFTSEISPNSSAARMWSNIHTFCGRKLKHDIHCISSPNDSSRNITGKS